MSGKPPYPTVRAEGQGAPCVLTASSWRGLTTSRPSSLTSPLSGTLITPRRQLRCPLALVIEPSGSALKGTCGLFRWLPERVKTSARGALCARERQSQKGLTTSPRRAPTSWRSGPRKTESTPPRSPQGRIRGLSGCAPQGTCGRLPWSPACPQEPGAVSAQEGMWRRG